MAWKNRIANAILTTTANLLFKARITDEATAYKAFRTHLLRKLCTWNAGALSFVRR